MVKTRINGRAALREWARGFKTQRRAAKALGISEVHLSRVLAGDRGLSDRILRRIGLKRIVVLRVE